jgi:hypothetical protein
MYKNSYVRTSATEYTRDSLDRAVHLVNDYVQKHEENYGKYEDSNKLSFDEFRAIMASHGKDFDRDVWPQIQQHTRHVFRATLSKLRRVDYSFELMGMDFMLDASFNVWLIEVITRCGFSACGTWGSAVKPLHKTPLHGYSAVAGCTRRLGWAASVLGPPATQAIERIYGAPCS